jgi:hypothetical protein
MFCRTKTKKFARNKSQRSVSSWRPVLEALEDRRQLCAIVYDVNMTGFTEGRFGPVDPDLSVVGTITYDTTAGAITASSLSILHPNVVAALPLTMQTLTSAYFQATPSAFYAVPTVGPGTLVDLWGTVSDSTYSFSIFDDSSGAIDVEVTGPPSVITGFHLGGFGEDGIFQSSTAVLIGTASNIATATTLTISGPAPTLLGQPFTLVAQVSDPNPVTCGSVDFYDGSTLIGSTPVSAGIATLTVSYLPTGNGHSFTANFNGAGNDLPSTSSPVVLADPTQAPTFFALQGSLLDQSLLAGSRNQEVDTGNAAALTLYDQSGNALFTLDGEKVNYVGGGSAIQGTIFATSNIANGTKITSSTYIFSLTLYDADLHPVTLDAFNAVLS